MKCLVKLLPVVTWKVEKVYNKLLNLSKVVSRHNAESISWLLLMFMIRYLQEGDQCKQELANLQTKLRGSIA